MFQYAPGLGTQTHRFRVIAACALIHTAMHFHIGPAHTSTFTPHLSYTKYRDPHGAESSASTLQNCMTVRENGPVNLDCLSQLLKGYL